MCGRFAIAAPRFERIEQALGVSFAPLAPRYNIAPTQPVDVVVDEGAHRYAMRPMRWGLVPHWSKEPTTKFSTFNARAETAPAKPAFRDAFRRRRCLIPASGFYEWKTAGKRKQPLYFTDDSGKGLAFAGLWDHWEGKADAIDSCTILVGPPNGLVAPVHDRMPVMLDEESFARWLDPQASPETLPDLLIPFPAHRMRSWPVDPAVGNARLDNPSLIEPVQPSKTDPKKLF